MQGAPESGYPSRNASRDPRHGRIRTSRDDRQVEMTEPRKALDQAGAQTSIVSPRSGNIRAWKFTEWGDQFPVDVPLDQARPENFDALLLLGGVINPDTLRMQPQAVAF